MTDKEFVIELEDDTEGHAGRGIVETDDAQWLEQKLGDSGTKRLRVLPDDRDDTEGHASDILVRAMLEDEDDTEGHAIAIHFPSRAEADAFRRRLLVTGVLVGTVALGAAGGVGLSALQSDAGATGANAAAIQADANYQAAAVAEADRQGAAGAAAQVGPLDAHEAPAFQQSATTADADRDIGIMDGSGAAAATQTGPMDAHEAPAFQQPATQVGPLDAHEAPAFQSSTTEDDDGNGLRNIGGPTPR